MKTNFAALVLGLFFQFGGFAQSNDSSVLRVTLTDPVGNVLVGAKVLLIADDGRQFTSQTDADGTRRIS